MIALEIAFPAGRFHATPWDRAVNEGEVEWPPSPWRLLRALVAGSANTGREDGEMLSRILDRLAGPPRYLLPPATASHTRHYVPLGSMERALVLDAFVAIDREARAYVVWDDAAIDGAEHEELERACSGVAYLGRAESWCTIRVVDAVPDDPDLSKVELAARMTTDGPSTRRLGVAADCRGSGLLAALSLPTGAMRQQRRLIPPGSVWLEYRFPAGFGLAPSTQTRADRARGAVLPPGGSVRFVLEGRNDMLRPSITETLAVAEAFRAASMRAYSSLTGESAPPQLSGKHDERPLEGHGHAFILPSDLDRNGRIDHIDVWFPEGTDHPTFRALQSLTKLWDWRLGKDETYALTFLGAAERRAGRVWSSATPFLLGAHPRTRGSEERRAPYEPEAQLLRSLAEHNFPKPTAISFWEQPATVRHARGGATLVSAFRAVRKDDRVIGRPFGVTLEFAVEVTGPLAIGRYAHFGMGQFLPHG